MINQNELQSICARLDNSEEVAELRSTETFNRQVTWHKYRQYLVHVAQESKNSDHVSALRIVVYPRPDHLKEFEKLNAKTAPIGPSGLYPGSIGTVLVDLPPSVTSSIAHATLNYVHAHFKREFPDNSVDPDAKIVKKYSNWRIVALMHAVKRCINQNVDLHVDLPEPFPATRDHRAVDSLNRDLSIAAAKLGYGFTRKIAADGVILGSIKLRNTPASEKHLIRHMIGRDLIVRNDTGEYVYSTYGARRGKKYEPKLTKLK